MTAVPLGEARDRLSEYVSEVERTHQRVTITRHEGLADAASGRLADNDAVKSRYGIA